MKATTLFDELDAEWEVIGRSAAGRTALARWQLGEPALDGLTTPADLVAVTERRGDPVATDAVLAILAGWAKVDEFAARSLLQALLPGARVVAYRFRGLGRDAEAAETVVVALYERIRTYPFERRPERIAANLLAEVVHYLVWEELRPAQRAHGTQSFELLGEADLLAPELDEPSSATSELLELLLWAVHAGHLRRKAAQLIASVRVADVSIEELAARGGTRPESLRRQRQRAERRLAEVARASLHERLIALPKPLPDELCA